MVKKQAFMKKRKKLWKYELLHQRKGHIKKTERVYEFFWLRKSWYYGFLGVKGDLFERRKLVERWFFLSVYNILRTKTDDLPVPKKNDKMIFV